MIPRLADGGASFKGAAAYYLADKRQPGEIERITSDRVAWTYTLNLPTQDPERAWKMMAHTAMSQADLKAAAGVKATGRKLTKPVMAYSLAWSPDEPPPAPHEMLEAAQESLAALGLELHQALIVCHNDTAHPHVHVIVNRVSQENGVAHNGSKAKLKLSAWAEAYEQRRGRILCLDRVENNRKRREEQKPKPEPKISRPQWEAMNNQPVQAGQVAAQHREMFGDQAAIERAGQERRFEERTVFHAKRRAGRNAIRDRYQAAIDGIRDPATARRRANQADLLMQADPSLGLAELTRDHSTFTRADLVRHVGRHTTTVADFQAVLDRLESSPELVRLGQDEQGRQRFTTRSHQAIEQRMLEHAEWLRATPKREVRPLWPKGLALSKDQDGALRHVLREGGLTSIVGYAGTGKSTLLAAARRSWESAGMRVQGMTLSGIAADGLKNGSGIDSRTIMSRLLQWEKGQNLPGPKDVIVVDEAGMIGSRQMERILQFAANGGAKVVLVGDPEQLQAIEAGGAFRMIVNRFDAANLATVRRQKAEWQQEATRELATNQTADALGRYEAAGMVHAHKTADQAKAALVEQWRQVRIEQPRTSQIILSYNNADVRDLNERARAVLKEAGELGPDTSLKTEVGVRNFAAGERIYFLKNDAGLGVRNGTLATILRIKGSTIVARLDGEEGRQVMFGIKSYGHVDHGYAATVHKSQGVTVDRAHLLASRSLNRHATYVAMTRHRDRLDVHWSEEVFKSRAQFVRNVGRAAVKDTSLDYDERDMPAAPAPKPAPPALSIEQADRLEALRQRRERSASPIASANRAPTHPAKPARPVGGRTQERLRQAAAQRDARQGQRDEMIARTGAKHVPPSAIEAPQPDQKDRVSVLLTAEMLAFDQETAAQSLAMETRHQAEIKEEQLSRQELTAEAALTWTMASQERPQPEPEIARDQPPIVPPKFSIDR